MASATCSILSTMSDTTPHLLSVEGLTVTFPSPQGAVAVVKDVSFRMSRGKLGIVGESGSGKSMTAKALMGLVPPPGRMTARHFRLGDDDLAGLNPAGWCALRGRRIGMILQDPKYSLNPVQRIGVQIEETLKLHGVYTKAERRAKAVEVLATVGIEDPERMYRAFPHELSGGMGQRAMIAIMLVLSPDLLIADEPTSALDVIVREQVLSLIDRLQAERGMGLILISHDLPMVARFCERILVMYRGRIVETIESSRLSEARHPYTQGLVACLPSPTSRGRDLPVLQRDAAWEQAS
jgi:peptide/nickel transport system ATP-binding protein